MQYIGQVRVPLETLQAAPLQTFTAIYHKSKYWEKKKEEACISLCLIARRALKEVARTTYAAGGHRKAKHIQLKCQDLF